jgi:hypothetical protein
MTTMHLILCFLDYPDKLPAVIELMRRHELGDPLILRAQSAAAALSINVPIFSGIRSVLGQVNEDRLILVSTMNRSDDESLLTRVEKIQKTLDAEPPPLGKFFVVPLANVKPNAPS